MIELFKRRKETYDIYLDRESVEGTIDIPEQPADSAMPSDKDLVKMHGDHMTQLMFAMNTKIGGGRMRAVAPFLLRSLVHPPCSLRAVAHPLSAFVLVLTQRSTAACMLSCAE